MGVFGSSGLRAIANDELDPGDVVDLAVAVGTELGGDRIALARDTRRSGGMFADAAASGLASVGLDVSRLGVVPTPALQYYCARESLPGVMITASHNPPQYNGMKVVGDDGVELTRDRLSNIEGRLASAGATVGSSAGGTTTAGDGAAEAPTTEGPAGGAASGGPAHGAASDATAGGDAGPAGGVPAEGTATDDAADDGATNDEATDDGASWKHVGVARSIEGVADEYVASVAAAVDREAIAAAAPTVVVDPGHGAACATSPDFFREIGCTVHTVNAQPDGHFPGRDPEPIAANLGDLRSHVRATDADLGIAHDGDGDRAMVVDETGSVVDGNALLSALVDAAVEAGDTVVSAANASRRLVEVVEAADAELALTPIGSSHVVARVREALAAGESVPIAGEANGGVMYPDYRLARDGAYTAARFLALLGEDDASDLLAPYEDYHNVRRSATYATQSEREAMLAAIERTASEAIADLDTTDGYRLNYGDGWVLARPSGTEPVIRIYAEALSADRAEALAATFADPIERALEAASAQ